MGHSWLRAAFINARERLIVALTVGRLRYAGRRDETKAQPWDDSGTPCGLSAGYHPAGTRSHLSAAEDGVEWGAVRGHQELRKIFFPIAGTTPPRLQSRASEV